MEEIWELFDEQGNKTEKTAKKGEVIPNGLYHLSGDIWIINSENKILIQKRSPNKKLSPNVWAMTGGSVIKGETSLQTIERETEEELGIKLNVKDAKLVDHYKTGKVWVDSYLVKQDIDLNDIVMQKEELTDVKWATYEEIEEIFQKNQFIEARWEAIRDIIKKEIKYED